MFGETGGLRFFCPISHTDDVQCVCGAESLVFLLQSKEKAEDLSEK